MPTYDYECQSCGHAAEIFQSIKEDPITTCPECGKDELKRLISAGVGIIFKGSGFYVTDSKKSASSSTSKSGGTDSAGSSETKSEKTTDKKSDSSSKKSDTTKSAKAG